jgi:NTE family protein
LGSFVSIVLHICYRYIKDVRGIMKRALVHSGGGAKGAWGAGVIQYLLGDLKLDYDIFCGVSVGAINTAFLSQFKKGEEEQAAKQMTELWKQLDTSKIYKRWSPFGKWHALWKKSFYDSSPLFNLIQTNIKLDLIRKSGKLVNVGAVSLSTGKYTVFDQSSDCFIEAVIASASFPGMLTPVSFLDQLWTDGGVKEISPIKKAIELGAEIIDVIITSPQVRVKRFVENPTTVDILKRSIDLSTDKIMANDIEKVEIYNKLAQAGLVDRKVVKLNILRPDFNLIEDLLDFKPEKIKEMMQKGYADAKHKYIM